MEITYFFYIVLNAILFLRAWLDTRLLRHLGKKSWKIKTVSVNFTMREPHWNPTPKVKMLIIPIIRENLQDLH